MEGGAKSCLFHWKATKITLQSLLSKDPSFNEVYYFDARNRSGQNNSLFGQKDQKSISWKLWKAKECSINIVLFYPARKPHQLLILNTILPNTIVVLVGKDWGGGGGVKNLCSKRGTCWRVEGFLEKGVCNKRFTLHVSARKELLRYMLWPTCTLVVLTHYWKSCLLWWACPFAVLRFACIPCLHLQKCSSRKETAEKRVFHTPVMCEHHESSYRKYE